MIKTFFKYLPFFICIATFFAYFAKTRLGTRARALGLMLLLPCASKFLAFDVLGGDAFAPELNESVIWVWNWAYSGMAILLGLLVLAWFFRGIIHLFRCRDLVQSRAFRIFWLVGLPVLAWTISARGVWNGIKPPLVEEVTIESAFVPVSLDGYRIVHISDIHAGSAATEWRTRAIVERVNAINADMVCLTGDYSDGFLRFQHLNIAPIGDLRAKDGVFAVTGNHEYYYDAQYWLMYYSSFENIRWLENECVFPRPGLAVAGVPDPVAERFGFVPPRPYSIFDSATNGEFRVLLQHRPITEDVPMQIPHLQLSGHTHGGVAPLMDCLVAAFNGGYVKGVYSKDQECNRFLNVSSGAGQWAGFPIRFFDDPTITVITLKHKANSICQRF